MDLQHRHFLVKMYVKMKELGPMGGMRPARPPDPPMDRSEITGLGVKLEIPLSKLERCFADSTDIASPTCLILHTWRQGQDPSTANKSLGGALIKAGLISVAREVLNYP